MELPTRSLVLRVCQFRHDRINGFYYSLMRSVCQQFVRPDIVDIWMGDSSERLVGRVYTHFPDKFMKSEMDKVVFEF